MAYTLTGQYVHGNGAPRRGRIKFAPSVAIAGDDKVILPSPLTVDLDSGGSFSVPLVGTDDVAYSPSGWVWSCTEVLDGGRTFSFELTADSDIHTLPPVAVPDEYSVYSLVGHDHTLADITDSTATGRAVASAADAAAARTAIGAGTSSFDGSYGSLSDQPTLGTAAALDVPASGDAAAGEVVKGDDTRLAGGGGLSGYDVVLLAGQSNMAGDGTGYTSTTDPQIPAVYQLMQDGSIEAATEPLDHPTATNGLGPGFPFARWYVAAGLNAGRDVLLVPAAVYSSPLVDAADPTWNPATADSLYDDAVARTNAVIAANAGSRLVAILWAQGEQDANDLVSGATYQTAMDALITAFRADLTDAADVPVVVGGMVPELRHATGRYAISAMQESVADRVAWTAWAPSPGGYYGGLHYTSAGYRELGRRYLDGLLSASTGIAGLRWGNRRVSAGVTLGLTSTGLQATATFSGANYDGDTPASWSVLWGDGDSDAGASSGVTHDYAAIGTYTVTVIADPGTSGALTASDQVVVSSSPLTATYTDSAVDTVDAAAFTFAGLSLGTADATRTVVVHIGGSTSAATITQPSVTVAGVSATVDHFTATPWGVWLAVAHVAIPTGTTGDVVVTPSASSARCAVGVYSVTGATWSEVDSDVGNNATTATVTGVAGGVVIAAAYGEQVGDVTWTGASEDYDEAVEVFQRLSGASTSATGSVTATTSMPTSGKRHIIACAYAPA